MLFKYNLGDRLKCRITGFDGIVNARIEYFNGCLQYGVKGPVDKDGKIPDAHFIDEAQLELVEAGAVVPPAAARGKSAARTGGPQADRPRV